MLLTHCNKQMTTIETRTKSHWRHIYRRHQCTVCRHRETTYQITAKRFNRLNAAYTTMMEIKRFLRKDTVND